MLYGFVVFDASTGALLHQRRFRRSFGLPGALQQLSLADPVGLALQLYAFNRFSGDLPGGPRLQHLQLTHGASDALDGAGLSISFASSEVAADQSTDAGRRLPVLALFSALPEHLAIRTASAVLAAFEAPGSAAGAAACRRKREEAALGVLQDWLVAEIADQLPGETPWLVLLTCEDMATAPSASGFAPSVPGPALAASDGGLVTGAVAPVGTSETPSSGALTPRPPPKHPLVEGQRRPQPFARRMLQRLHVPFASTPAVPHGASEESGDRFQGAMPEVPPYATAAASDSDTRFAAEPSPSPPLPPGPKPVGLGKRPQRPMSVPSRKGPEAIADQREQQQQQPQKKEGQQPLLQQQQHEQQRRASSEDRSGSRWRGGPTWAQGKISWWRRRSRSPQPFDACDWAAAGGIAGAAARTTVGCAEQEPPAAAAAPPTCFFYRASGSAGPASSHGLAGAEAYPDDAVDQCESELLRGLAATLLASKPLRVDNASATQEQSSVAVADCSLHWPSDNAAIPALAAVGEKQAAVFTTAGGSGVGGAIAGGRLAVAVPLSAMVGGSANGGGAGGGGVGAAEREALALHFRRRLDPSLRKLASYLAFLVSATRGSSNASGARGPRIPRT